MDQVRNEHLAVGAEVIHTAHDAVAVGSDPHIGIPGHLAAADIEQVIILPDLGKAQGQNVIRVVIGIAVAAGHKAGLDQSALCVEGMPIALGGNKAILLADPDGGACGQNAVGLCVIILAVQLVQAVGHLHTVNGEVQLPVLLDDLLLSVDQIGDEHLAIGGKVVHTRLNAIAVGAHPHIGILIHLAASGIEQVIVAADLLKASQVLVVLEAIGITVDHGKAVADDIALFVAPILAGFQRAILRGRAGIHIASGVHVDLAAGGGVDDTVSNVDQAIEGLAVGIAVIQLPAIVKEAIAKAGHKAGFFVKVIPRNILDIGCDGMCVAIGHIPVHIQPIGALLQGHEPTEPGLPCHEILGAVFIGAESAPDHLSGVVKGIGKAPYLPNAGVHFVVVLIKVIEIGGSVLIGDGLPAGGQNAKSGVIMLSVQGKDARQLLGTGSVLAQIIPELAAFSVHVAGQLVDAGQRRAVLEIGPNAILPDPAVLVILAQLEAVGEFHNRVEEVGTVIRRIIGAVVIGVQAILYLILLLLRQRFEHMEVGINIIAQITGHRAVQASAGRPGSLLGNELQTAEYAQGIGRGRVDGLRLFNKVADHRQLVSIHLGGGQRKVLIGQPKVGRIRRKPIRDRQIDGDGGQRADPLGQLKQEVPSRPPLLVTAGQHKQQGRQLFGDGHFGHIYGEGIGDRAALLKIRQIIGLFFLLINCAADITIPGKQSAAAGGRIEVKIGFITLIHICRDLGGRGQRLIDGRRLRLDRSVAVTVSLRFGLLIGTDVFLVHNQLEFAQFAFQNGANGQGPQLAGFAGSKLEVLNGAGLRIVKDQFRLGGIDASALHVADGLQGDLHIAELHIAGIDLHLVAVIRCLQWQIHCGAIDGIDALLRKPEVRGLDHVQRLGAENRAILRHKLDLYIAQRQRSEHIVPQAANRFVGNLKRSAGRNLDCTAGGGHAGHLHGKLRAHGQVVILRRDHRMVKLVGGLRRGNHQQRGADRPLIAVGRTVYHGNGVGAFRLGCECGGSAAVQVHCGNTAGIQHDLCHLVGAAAGGEGLLTAIQDHHDHPSVIGDADAGTRLAGLIIFAGRIPGHFAVLDQPNGRAYRFLHLVLIGLPLGRSANDRRPIL